jgi:class 3 adenylate cyclase
VALEPSRETTVLFAAIIGRQDLYAKAGDQVAHEAMERCQFRLGQAAASCGGRLSKSTADKVMVLAATPDGAADAASAMHLAMEKLPKTAGVKLAIGIGLHCGPIIQKGDDVFGDTVNLAARLCESAGGGQIILTEWTAKLLSPLYRAWMRKLDSAQLKGRSEEVGLCELVWKADDNATAFKRTQAEDKAALPAVLRLKYRGQRLELRREKEVLTIGRGEDCGLIVHDNEASRHHCTIERRKDKFVLTDVSTNGTYVTIEGEKEMELDREQVTLSKRGWITFGEPRVHATEVVEFFLGPAPARPASK